MRKALLIGAAFAALTSSAFAQETRWYRVGSPVKYGNLVKDPDVTIQYVMFDPGHKVATLSVRTKDCGPKDVLRVDIAQGDERWVVVKNDCSDGTCKAFLVRLVADIIEPGGDMRLKESVQVVPSYMN